MSVKVKFLTGAPSSTDLTWNEHDLLNGLLPPFILEIQTATTPSAPSPALSTRANWRHVNLNGEVFAESPLQHKQSKVPHIRPFSSIIETSDDFIEHSLAILDALQSSQLAPHEQADLTADEESTFLTNESFTSSLDGSITSPGFIASTTPLSRQPLKPIRSLITPLNLIPSAKHLLRSRPQTITVNLIVGIISISTPRTVHVKRGSYNMEILEMTVGDETKAGFSVSIWMTPQASGQQTSSKADLRTSVKLLRPGNVVYIGRLALADFNGQVFGQSLNRKSSGVVTSFVALDAAVMARSILHDPEVVAKTERVSAWVDEFVGSRNGQARKRKLDNARSEQPVKSTRTARVKNREWLPYDSPG